MIRRLTQALVSLALIGGGIGTEFAAATTRPPAIAPGFHVVSRGIRLPRPCAQPAARAMVVELLREFRSGRGARFARRFAADAVFQPYNGTNLAPDPGRRGIERFVVERHAAGDVWTGTALIPPTSSDRRLAIYGLNLQAFVGGHTFKGRGAKIVVRCDSGQIRGWVGPVIPRQALAIRRRRLTLQRETAPRAVFRG